VFCGRISHSMWGFCCSLPGCRGGLREEKGLQKGKVDLRQNKEELEAAVEKMRLFCFRKILRLVLGITGLRVQDMREITFQT